MVMPPRVAPTQLVGIPIPNAKLSAGDRDALTIKVRPLHCWILGSWGLGFRVWG